MTRRTFLQHLSYMSLGTVLMPQMLFADDSPRLINLYNIHTDEYLDITYYKNGSYLPDALLRIDQIMIDRRSGDTTAMDTKLIDTLYSLQTLSNTKEPLEIICGYRSPATNAHMSQPGSGVAKHSFHTLGKAADIHIQNLTLEQSRALALTLQAGGVGYYPKSGFIHVDVGPIRQWIG